jgi:hypothetical protein
VNDVIMNKGLHPREVKLTIQALREAERQTGIHVDVGLALIYPTPTRGVITHEEVFEANLNLVAETQPDSVLVTPPGPFIHTEWNEHSDRYDFELAEDWIDRLIRYEYVLYKPPFLWKELPIRFGGKSFTEALELCGKMRRAIDELGIPTDLSDEHFLMLRAAGFSGRAGAAQFKELTSLDVVSGSYGNIRDIAHRVNLRSAALAMLQRRPVRVTEPGAVTAEEPLVPAGAER